VVCRGDRSTSPFTRADGPILLKGCRPLDRGLVRARGFQNRICRSVAGNGAFRCCATGGIVCAEILHNVVFNQRACGPAVDGEVAVAVGSVSGAIVDDPSTSRVPSLSSDKVTVIACPYGTVFTTWSVVIGDLASAVSPERIVVAIVGAS